MHDDQTRREENLAESTMSLALAKFFLTRTLRDVSPSPWPWPGLKDS